MGPDPRPPPPSVGPDATAGRRYRVLGTIGSGGFGTVYKVELLGEGGFSRVFALKVLNPDVEGVGEVAQRLRDEARILGLVRHRAIVQVDALVALEGRWAVLMECVEGVDLRDVVALGPVPPGPASEIVEEVAEALHQASVQLGPDGAPLCLLHRDIKPSNVQITAAGEVKLLDFGTARANFAGREARTRELAFGTLEYMSPERMEFEDSAAGDVYALGALFFELLVAQPLGRTAPVERRHAQVLAHAHEGLVRASVPPELGELVLACLAWKATDRPTADAVARACRRYRGQGQSVWLAEWAAATVPALLARRGPLRTDEVTGRVLVEQSEPPPAPPPVAPVPPPPAPPGEGAPGATVWVPHPPAAPAAAASPLPWVMMGAAVLGLLVLAPVGIGIVVAAIAFVASLFR